jgi:glycosyltransferase involved in cell wall biosynthesis
VHVAFVGATEPAYETDVRNRLPASFKERVRFAGLSDEGAAWIAAADILVNTSRSEAFPRTFLEAAVMGTPIIASAVDGANERLRDGVSALLYPPGDINALAARITQLVDDQASGSALAAAARADLSGSWTWEAMVEAYARLLLRAAR